MKIQTQYENTRCRICGTHIPFGADCIWVSGTPGVTCVNPCQPAQTVKKPRKNQPERLQTQGNAIPVSTKHLLTIEQAGAIRESLVNLDDASLRLIQSLIDDLLSDATLPVPVVNPPKAPFPAPVKATDSFPYHMECNSCGHIEDIPNGKPARCGWCQSEDISTDRLGGCFNPVETHKCKQWAFHDAQNPEHKRNCTQCQLTPEVYTDLSIPTDRKTVPIIHNGVKVGEIEYAKPAVKPVKPVVKPVKPKFSF